MEQDISHAAELHSLPLSELIEFCHLHTLTYLRAGVPGDDRYCLELFRRAVQDGDQGAWAFIYTFYSTEEFLGEHYVLKWVRSWMGGRYGASIRASYTEEEMVQEIWLRFMHSNAARTFNFSGMRPLMAFLRRLVNNFALDAARRKQLAVIEPSSSPSARSAEDVLPDDHQSMEELMVNQEAMDSLLNQVIGDVLLTEKEWLVFRGYFLDELPPRKLYTLHPGTFAPGEVENTRTRIARRLRRAPYLLRRYIRLVVLGDDERLSLVFDCAFAAGWPDSLILQRYPTHFDGQADLLRCKVQVLTALRRRPNLLHLLGHRT
jgi:DNA-directed RNA polymerase specialized sigma24 family protein